MTGCGTNASNNSATSQGSGSSSASSNAKAGTISSGASLGLQWSPADQTLRPIVGVPGSSWLGASVVTAGAYTSASYCAASGVALLTDSHGNLSLISSASQSPQVLAQGAPSSAHYAFSPNGQRAAVFAPNSGSALLVTGLLTQPGVSTFTSTSAIAALALSDDGALLIASPGSAGVTITEVSSTGARATVATLAGFGGMAFLPGSDDFLLADSVQNTLVRVHNGTAQTLATHTDGLNQPLAVATSADGQWAVTANSADGVLVRVNLFGVAAPTRALCACSPSELTPLAGNAVFELTEPGKSASWMIDAARNTPSVFFIPPTHSNTTGSSK
ncbi:MAG: YncE family protein [Acidobacteriaceae bacterium]